MEIQLQFNHEDEGLHMSGQVNFPDRANIIQVSTLSVRGLAEWRHIPSNMINLNEQTIANLKMVDNAKKLTRSGIQWMGIKAGTDILLSHAIRTGRNGVAKVRDQLTKFFKALGASSVVIDIEENG